MNHAWKPGDEAVVNFPTSRGHGKIVRLKSQLFPIAGPPAWEMEDGTKWSENYLMPFGVTAKPAPAADPVNRVGHYQGANGLEVLDVADAFGLNRNAYLFNVLKYILRADRKGSAIDDLRKARVYLDREITNREKKESGS